jgi:acyl-CoA synthetase (AMP-forming)/AMP-acid ligase II
MVQGFVASGQATLVDLLRGQAEAFPGRGYTFLLDGDEATQQLTLQDLHRQACAIAASLRATAGQGERALLLFPPGLAYVAAFFGCLYAGITAVPAYPPHAPRLLGRLQTIIRDAQARIIISTSALQAMAQPWLAQTFGADELHWLATDALAQGVEAQWHEPNIGPQTVAFLQYTSGSTAAPKGVIVTHSNLLHNQQLIQHAFQTTADDICISWLPLYHDMGLIGNLLQPLFIGCTCVLMSPLVFLQRPARWLQAISRYRATISGGPNFAYDLCVRKIRPEQRAELDLSSWHLAFNGAEHVRADTLDRFAAAFADCGFRREVFYPCYGLAEATLIVAGGEPAYPPVVRPFCDQALSQGRVVEVSPDEPRARLLVSSGRVLPPQHVAIVSPETGEECARDRVGEIWVSGPSVAGGYWNRPELTEQVFQASLGDDTERRYLRTGDIGFVYEGQLFIVGRIKDLIIINGRNYYPQDIELIVERCHPAMRTNCGAAIALEQDGTERLVIVQEVERHVGAEDREAIISAIREAVSNEFELGAQAIVLIKAGSIPRTSSGKIQRHQCREAYLARTLDLWP